jgi:hypothetical protein
VADHPFESMTTREREQDDGAERGSKRTKLGSAQTIAETNPENPLPPSHVLLGKPPPISDGFMFRIQETDVGISEYIGQNIPKIDGIIKQR